MNHICPNKEEEEEEEQRKNKEKGKLEQAIGC